MCARSLRTPLKVFSFSFVKEHTYQISNLIRSIYIIPTSFSFLIFSIIFWLMSSRFPPLFFFFKKRKVGEIWLKKIMRHITINHTLQPNWDFFKPDELSISRQPAILANLCAASLTETKTLSNIFISSNKWPSKVRFSVTSSFLSFFPSFFFFFFFGWKSVAWLHLPIQLSPQENHDQNRFVSTPLLVQKLSPFSSRCKLFFFVE